MWSGGCDLGDVRVDANPRKSGLIKANMRELPFADESFQTVISDPSWRTDWFNRWKPFFELVRVCRVGGRTIFNSYYVPWSTQVELRELFVRQDERFANASVMSVFERTTNRNPENRSPYPSLPYLVDKPFLNCLDPPDVAT